ncbi:MAG: ester cyclase [Thermodesulfobacteriota bacterium]|nr:ester cyclase [Thermodesulfobacteriota bacterium]
MHKDIETIIISANDELITKGNFDVIDKFFVSEYIVHAGRKNYTGHEFIKKWARQLRLAIPDIQVAKIDILIRTENTIAWQRTLKGTHKDKIMGISPTDQKIEWREMAVSRFNS